MDFSFGLDRLGYLGASENGVSEQKSCGSVLKQGRPCGFLDDNSKTPQVSNDTCKMLKWDDVMSSKPMLLPTKPTILRSHALFPDANLEFSSLNKPDGTHDSMQTAILPSFHSSYCKTPGLSWGSLNGDMHGVLGVVRVPFTPSQWLELEHQALIFKYIIAGVPIPPNLLLPIRRSMNPSPLSTFCAASVRPNAFGWGPFHLGFSGNPDPEPGRCRRTDGKKWRCSRDAVADQKYCERHINRGRHRSRKPVEGQTGQATAGTTAASASKAAPVTAPSSTAPVSGNAPESLNIAQHQIKPLHQSANPSSAAANFSRFLINKRNVEDRIQNPQTDLLQSSVNLKERESFSLLKQHLRLQESRPAFGMISSDSLLSDAQRNSYLQSKNFGLSSDLNAREPQQAHSLHSFIDDWPKIEEAQPERTLLSISKPVASSCFSLASPSQNQDKFALSPLKLTRETDPTQMGLGVGMQTDSLQSQTNWALPSWETSLGGPLAEVLNSTNTNASLRGHKNSSALNLMTQGWDVSSPLESSPTGVLTRTAFFSLSNSSAGSSPRAETNKANDNSLSDEPLGSNVLSSATIIQS